MDTDVFTYGNHAAAPSNAQTQVISITDINYCLTTTEVTATKTSVVLSDPVSGTEVPEAMPGAVVEYCVLVSNTGSAPVENAIVVDLLPANVQFEAGSLTTGSH